MLSASSRSVLYRFHGATGAGDRRLATFLGAEIELKRNKVSKKKFSKNNHGRLLEGLFLRLCVTVVLVTTAPLRLVYPLATLLGS